MRSLSTERQKVASRMLSRRAAVLLGAKALVLGALGWRMHDLGIRKSSDYAALAEENRISIRLIPPARGLIYDRTGAALALNEVKYKVDIVREQVGDLDTVFEHLAALIPIDDADIERARDEMARRRAFVPITVASGLSWSEIARVAANSPVLPGVIPGVGWQRSYPQGAAAAHVVGYVGPVSEYDLNRIDDKDPLLLIPRYQIGKNGVENKLEGKLRGGAGIRRMEVNSVGQEVRELSRTSSEAGKTLQLTIDAGLQHRCLELLGAHSGSAVVLDAWSGDVLALVSAPSFEPEKFVTGISVDDWEQVNENPLRPLLNKAVTGTYPPGSTFKLVVALAALEAGLISQDEEIRCRGQLEVPDRVFHCWKPGGHGHVNLRTSISQSCDVFYYEVARRVGIDRISDMARRLGLGVRHDLPLPAVQGGLMPTRDWKQQNRNSAWLVGDTLNAGIGQGYVLASPLQLAVMTARLASGRAIVPNLVNFPKDIARSAAATTPLEIDQQHLELVRLGMKDVVNHRRGTAYASRIREESRQLAGKTGTSQVRLITKSEREEGVTKNEDRPWEHRDHALFVAYSPLDEPRYAVAVVVEHGGSGSAVAAPVARGILETAFDLGMGSYKEVLNTLPNGSDGSGSAGAGYL